MYRLTDCKKVKAIGTTQTACPCIACYYYAALHCTAMMIPAGEQISSWVKDQCCSCTAYNTTNQPTIIGQCTVIKNEGYLLIEVGFNY